MPARLSIEDYRSAIADIVEDYGRFVENYDKYSPDIQRNYQIKHLEVLKKISQDADRLIWHRNNPNAKFNMYCMQIPESLVNYLFDKLGHFGVTREKFPHMARGNVANNINCYFGSLLITLPNVKEELGKKYPQLNLQQSASKDLKLFSYQSIVSQLAEDRKCSVSEQVMREVYKEREMLGNLYKDLKERGIIVTKQSRNAQLPKRKRASETQPKIKKQKKNKPVVIDSTTATTEPRKKKQQAKYRYTK